MYMCECMDHSLKKKKGGDTSSSTEVDFEKSSGFVGRLATVNTSCVENLNSINRRWGRDEKKKWNDLQRIKSGSSERL